jgi:UDP-2,3-diacylglucosamine hydrolase
MAIYFVSDSHFGAPYNRDQARNVELFRKFIDNIRPSAEHLYILGDLFDFWFEYRDGFPDEYPEVTGKLKELSRQGIGITFIGGNHDWWAGRTFVDLTGAEVARSGIEATHYGKKIYLEHGDGIAGADRGYRLMRKILRNRLNIWLFSRLHSSLGMALARSVSFGSHSLREGRQWKFLPEYEEYASSILNGSYDSVILGHTHIPYRKDLGNGLYLNTGDWIKYHTYVRLDENGFAVMTFTHGKPQDFDTESILPENRHTD